MLVLSTLRASARLTAVVGLLFLFAGGGLARSTASSRLGTLDPAAPPALQPMPPQRMAALEPAASANPRPAPTSAGPFGLATAESGLFSARWRTLQPLIRLEMQILESCRAQRAGCQGAAAKLSSIIETASRRSGRARLGEVNRAVNLAIRPMSDLAQYGVPDFWASPLTTFASGAGDCDDYAIAKYVALNLAGLPASDLRLVAVHDRRTDQGHLEAAARLDGQWIILDNRTMRLVPDSEVPDLTPLAALGGDDDAPALAGTPSAPAAPSAEAWNTAGLAIVL